VFPSAGPGQHLRLDPMPVMVITVQRFGTEVGRVAAIGWDRHTLLQVTRVCRTRFHLLAFTASYD
jgi:hypothetical protein